MAEIGKFSGETLDEAFRHNSYHFTAGNVLGGLVDLITELTNDYGAAHGIQNLNSRIENANGNASSEVESIAAPDRNNNSSAPDEIDASSTVPSNPFPDQVKRASPSGGEDVSSITDEGPFTSPPTIAPSEEESSTTKESDGSSSGNAKQRRT